MYKKSVLKILETLIARLESKIENWELREFEIELEKVHFMKMNELKLTQVEIFSFIYFVCVAANKSELFCAAHLANIERFLYHSRLSL